MLILKNYKNQTEMDLFEKEVCIAFRKIYYQEFKEYLHETNESQFFVCVYTNQN